MCRISRLNPDAHDFSADSNYNDVDPADVSVTVTDTYQETVFNVDSVSSDMAQANKEFTIYIRGEGFGGTPTVELKEKSGDWFDVTDAIKSSTLSDTKIDVMVSLDAGLQWKAL